MQLPVAVGRRRGGEGTGADSTQVPHLPLFFKGRTEHWHRKVDKLLHFLRFFLPCTALQASVASTQRTRRPPHRQVELSLQGPFPIAAHAPPPPGAPGCPAAPPAAAAASSASSASSAGAPRAPRALARARAVAARRACPSRPRSHSVGVDARRRGV